MKFLVFGQTGQVATELSRLTGVTTVGRHAADLMDADRCAALISDCDADVIINAAAYTAVDKAEQDSDTAKAVNEVAPTEMAAAAAARNIPFVHISTDYVFDGSPGAPWLPGDATGPLGVYGATKLGGENGVRAAGGTHVVLRTSWVFSEHGNNFVKTMLRLGAERDALTVVCDQIGGPTSARAIAATCYDVAHQLCADPGKTGTYHFSGAPDVSWADFARTIFDKAGISVQVSDIPSSDYPTPAQRPMNSKLDCGTLREIFGIERPDWRADLDQVLNALKNI